VHLYTIVPQPPMQHTVPAEHNTSSSPKTGIQQGRIHAHLSSACAPVALKHCCSQSCTTQRRATPQLEAKHPPHHQQKHADSTTQHCQNHSCEILPAQCCVLQSTASTCWSTDKRQTVQGPTAGTRTASPLDRTAATNSCVLCVPATSARQHNQDTTPHPADCSCYLLYCNSSINQHIAHAELAKPLTSSPHQTMQRCNKTTNLTMHQQPSALQSRENTLQTAV